MVLVGRPGTFCLPHHLHVHCGSRSAVGVHKGVAYYDFSQLVPRVEWGPEVFTWVHDTKRRDMIPFVKRMHGVGSNQPLEAGVLPPNLAQLTFDREFNQPLAAGVLPVSLTQLTFGGMSNHPLAAGVLPPNLTQMTFKWQFNQPLAAGVLPPNLTQLTLNREFNQPLAAGVLPANLTQLTFWQHVQPALDGGRAACQPDPNALGDFFNQPLAADVLAAGQSDPADL